MTTVPNKRDKKTEQDAADRRTLIRHALLGLDYWLYGRAFLLPFCDYLKLFLQRTEPIIVTLWDTADTRAPVFSTRPDVTTNFSEEFATRISNLETSIHRAVVSFRSDGASFVGEVEAKELLGKLFSHPDFTESREGKLFVESLERATPRPVNNNEQLAVRVLPSEISGNKLPESVYETYQTLFESSREVLEKSDHFRVSASTKWPTINLFPFVIVAKPVSGAADLQILEAFPATPSTRELVDVLGDELLGREANEAFQTGTITLAKPLKRLSTKHSQKLTGLEAFGEWHRIYIPIHVEGAAWIVLLRFIENSGTPGWFDVFHFYHDVIPRIGAMLRSETKAGYLDLIERFFAEEIANPDSPSFVSRFNDRSATLLAHFPFPRLYLTEATTAGQPLLLPNGRHVTVVTEPNPFFHAKWTYDPLGTLGRDACVRAGKAFSGEERRIRARFLGHRHSMVNLKPAPVLRAALLQDKKQLSGKARVFVEDAAKISDLLFATLDFVSTPTRTHPPLLNKSLGEILGWLKQRQTSGVARANLRIKEGSDFLPAKEMMEDVYLVLWNLWHNAAAMAGDCFDVTLSQDESSRIVVFSQQGEWLEEKRQWIDFLNGAALSPNQEQEPSGLEIVKQSLYRLKWDISAIASPGVKIQIQIPNS